MELVTLAIMCVLSMALALAGSRMMLGAVLSFMSRPPVPPARFDRPAPALDGSRR